MTSSFFTDIDYAGVIGVNFLLALVLSFFGFTFDCY